MFAIGMIGFLAGVLFKKGWLRRTRASLAVFGAFTAVIIYGGIMNPAAAMMMSSEALKWETILACYVTGLPMDLIHGFGAVIFLMIAAEPMLEKMDWIKVKYGIGRVIFTKKPLSKRDYHVAIAAFSFYNFHKTF